MIEIRGDQMAALQRATEARFAAELADFLRRRCAAALDGLDAAEVAALVARGIAMARAAGFTWQRSIAQYVTLLVELGPDWARHPAIATRLGWVQGAGEYRLGELVAATPPDLWRDVADPDRAAALRALLREAA
jgi:hypothetical protein